MSEEEKKAIEILKDITHDDLLNCWEGGEEEYNSIQTILSLISRQQEKIEDLEKYDLRKITLIPEEMETKRQQELELKDKVIDSMVEHIMDSAVVDDTICGIKFCEKEEDCSKKMMRKCTKQYFINKAKEEE